MISMLLWHKTEEKTKHSIWFSRRYNNNSIFHSILPLQTIHLLLYNSQTHTSSKLYFRMWNYYCGKLQLCWKPLSASKYKKCCTKCMITRMNDLSTILHTTVSELWNSDLKKQKQESLYRKWEKGFPVKSQLIKWTQTQKTHLWKVKIGTSMFVTFFYSLYN